MLRSTANRALRLHQQSKLYPKQLSSLIVEPLPNANVEYPENWDTAKPFSAVPGPMAFPVIGTSWKLPKGLDVLKLAHEMRSKYGDIAIMRKLFAIGDMLFLFNIKDIEWVSRNEGLWPIRQTLISMAIYRHQIRKDIFGETYGLINGQHEHWGSFRTAVNPIMMQPRTTHQYVPQINEIADEFIERVKVLKMASAISEMPHDFIDEINKWSFESITAIALDTRLGCLDEQPSEKAQLAIKYILEMFSLYLKLDLLPSGKYHRTFNTSVWKRFIKCNDYFTNMVFELIDQATERIKNDSNYAAKPEHEKSVFEKLVAKDKKIAMVMILDMMQAGVDTTGKIIGACLYFLSRNQEAQNRLRDELRQLLPTKNSPINKEILNAAKYLRACIKETLRIAPIGFSKMRTLPKPLVLSGYQVPAGVLVSMPHHYLSIGTDEHYTNPLTFLPERWLRSERSDNISPFVSLPFSVGARCCIGQRMANMEIEIIVAKMVRNFVLEWKHKDMRFKQDLLYGIADPLKLKLTDISG